MKQISIFNHVLGPVMRGPSSSHTAGAFHIASMVRSMVGGLAKKVLCSFDPGGSYAHTYAQQGADRAFAMGLLNRPLTDETFFQALELSPAEGLDLQFSVQPIPGSDHPNMVQVQATGQDGASLELLARSIGGGEIEITSLLGWPVLLNGAAHVLAVEVDVSLLQEVASRIEALGFLLVPAHVQRDGAKAFLLAQRSQPAAQDWIERLRGVAQVHRVLQASPVYYVQVGPSLYQSAAEMVSEAERRGLSLGEIAVQYEAKLLGLEPRAVVQEMLRRYAVMEQSVQQGLEPGFAGMQLLAPSAGNIFQAEAEGRLSLGGPHVRAAARAMAVMHVNGAMGVVCAAPTGGAAGTLPGTIVTLAEERHLGGEAIARALFAAGAVGTIVAKRATFAAEVAGCQVEIGAAGAMAAAAVVETMGGTAAQACHAAAIAFQNTMGSVCDLVQGMVEIPCHTRNAVAAANAFLCADIVLGGYTNPVPLDETIDAVYAVGLMMPSELRCTAKGGLAVAPSAASMKPQICCSRCGRC
jgi:L-serine dehydratase